MVIDTERRPIRTAAIANLGCKVNQSEMEGAARRLRERGVTIVDGDRPADLVLVNTCTVTAEADAKSRHAVRRARRASPDAPIVVTGCSVQVGREAFAAADPSARARRQPGQGRAPGRARSLLEPAGPAPDGGGSLVRRPLPTLSGVDIEGIADDRASVERTRAFVKVQDGCSFFCTYCIIPTARGPERSLAPEVVLGDVRRALAAGHREIVLTGINIGTYDGGWSERGFRGAHRRSALTLAGLVRRLLDETRCRADPDLLDRAPARRRRAPPVWADGAPRTLPHVHLPLQSGDDGVLRRMGRRYGSADYAAVVGRVREAIPGVAIHGDAIVGFPTEDAAAWERSLAFIRRSASPACMCSAIPPGRGRRRRGWPGRSTRRSKKARAAELLAVAADARERWAAGRVGAIAEVLFEVRLADGRWVGHAADYSSVAAVAAAPEGGLSLENAIGRVRLVGGRPRPARSARRAASCPWRRRRHRLPRSPHPCPLTATPARLPVLPDRAAASCRPRRSPRTTSCSRSTTSPRAARPTSW